MAYSVSLIVAADGDGIIGVNGKLPWHIPKDLKRFKQITMGGVVIMGRKTYESIGKPLPGRTNIVMSRGVPDGYQPYEGSPESGVMSRFFKPLGEDLYPLYATKLKAALTHARMRNLPAFIIGGAEIYYQAEKQASRLYFTRVSDPILQPQSMVGQEIAYYYPNWDDWNTIKETLESDHCFTEAIRRHQ